MTEKRTENECETSLGELWKRVLEFFSTLSDKSWLDIYVLAEYCNTNLLCIITLKWPIVYSTVILHRTVFKTLIGFC